MTNEVTEQVMPDGDGQPEPGMIGDPDLIAKDDDEKGDED